MASIAPGFAAAAGFLRGPPASSACGHPIVCASANSGRCATRGYHAATLTRTEGNCAAHNAGRVHSEKWRRFRCALPQAVSVGIALSDRSSSARSPRLERGSSAGPLQLFCTATARIERGADSRFASGMVMDGDVAAHVAATASVCRRIFGELAVQPVALGAYGVFSVALSTYRSDVMCSRLGQTERESLRAV